MIRLSSLGDVILASSVPLALKHAVPDAEVTFLTRETFAGVFKSNPAVDEITSFSPRGNAFKDIVSAARELRSRRFDLILDLQCNPRTFLLSLLARPRACIRIERDALVRHAMVRFKSLRPRRVRHAVQRFLGAVERAFGPVPAFRPQVFLTETERNAANGFVRGLRGGGKRPIVGVCPGARWKTKMWGAERMSLLAQSLHAEDVDVCVLGGRIDNAVIRDMKGRCEMLEGAYFCDGDLRYLATLMSRCDCVVSNESGLMHMAHAVGTPVVAVFGSTVPEFGFYPPDSRSTVISKSLGCKPCDVHGQDKCREDDMRCMDSIDVSEVLEEVRRVLKNRPGAGCEKGGGFAAGLRLELPRFVLGEGDPSASGSEWSVPPSGPIAVRVPNWVGDAVMAHPSLAALRGCGGGLKIVAVAHKRVANLFENGRLADKLVHVSTGGGLDLLRAAFALRRNRCIAGVTMPDSFSSALMLRLGGVKKIVGFRGELRDGMLAVRLRRERWNHLCEQYAQLLPSGCAATEKADLVPSLAELDRARDLVGGPGASGTPPFALLAPGATYGATKRWPEDNYVKLAVSLTERAGLQVILIGSRAESGLCTRIAEACPAPVSNLSGKTSLRDLVALASLAALFVGNDSGAAHVAAASGCPVVVIFGSSDPSWTEPRGDRVKILYEKMSCSPCFLRECAYDLSCLKQIGVEEVYRAAMELYGESREQELGR